jgi:Xaa-Pro dipeptidase
MFSRRSFVRIAAGAAAAGMAPVGSAQRGQTVRAFGGPVPPSIAALQPMTGSVRPFTSQEREARIEKARNLMAKEKIAAVVLTGGASTQ